MKKISMGLTALTMTALLCFTSCSEENPWSGPEGEGRIQLNLSADARVMRQTRADDSLSPVVPHTDSFSVALSKSDGSYSKTWATLPQFERESSFAIGDYTLTATYGDVNKEGFDSPAYKGLTDVHVSPGALSEVNVTATLANAMVSVRYTERFEQNFKAYSAAVQTEGHDWVVFAQNESRPAYISPCDDVKLNVTLTNDAGQTVTVQPAGFQALPRHHYVMTIDVDDSDVAGNLKLTVTFDEDVVVEKVDVNITDEFWTAPKPTLTTKGYESGMDVYENAELSVSPEFNVIAFGGMAAARLNIVTDSGYSPSFGYSVELIGSTSLQQQQLENEGVACAGFFRTPDRMGVVNIKKFLSRVPAGNYTVSLEVKDTQTRVETVSMEVKVSATEFQLEANDNANFFSKSLSVDVLTNAQGIKDNVTFRVPNERNQMVEAPVVSVTEIADASGSKRLRYVLECDAIITDKMDVQATLGNKNRSCVVNVNAPVYEIETDAFSNRVVVKVRNSDAELVRKLANSLSFYNGDAAIPSSNIEHSSNTDIIVLKGLTPGVTYTSLKAKYLTFEKSLGSFTTETAVVLPNGDFSQTSQTINFSDVALGGQYRVSPVDYQWKTNIVRDEPTGWASLNSLTCYSGSQNKNSWFMVPSTFSDNGAVVIRTVGYNHNGVTPAKSGGAFNIKYYCENAPSADQLEKSVGELFLGSYSFDGTAHRTDGIDFTSRPASVSFRYKYVSVNNEDAKVEAKVLDASGNVISSGTVLLKNVSEMSAGTLNFSSYGFGKKASKLLISFKSSSSQNPSIRIPSGSELNQDQSVLGSRNLGNNVAKAYAQGSELTVDDVVLNYD